MSDAAGVVVAVWDGAVSAFSRPMFVPSTQYAVRMFSDEVNRAAEDNPLYRHPDDYQLEVIAHWDENTGIFVGVDRRVLVRASDVKQA